MKKVLLLTSVKQTGRKPTYLAEEAFVEKLTQSLGNEVSITMAALPELMYQTGTTTKIWHPIEGYDVADFDAVVVRKVGNFLELGIAIAHYADYHKIPFTDQYLLTSGNGKLACAFIRALKGLPVPETLYGPVDHLLASDFVAYPVVVKADIGRAGQDNFLVKDAKQHKEILESYDGQIMVTQAYIPNDGDYRVLILNHKPVMAILRQKADGSHLNNTSQGGRASLVDLNQLSKKLLHDAAQASRLEKVEVAGVDIMIDTVTNLHKIIEVNRAPQIPSGTFVDEKVNAYAQFIKNLTIGRAGKRPIATIGRAENIHFPEIIDASVAARIDTGAQTSSIWGSAHETDDGRLAVTFFGEGHDHFKQDVYYFDEFDQTVVASSNGQRESRYKIKLLVVIGKRRIRARFTIADRATQTYPVLIGRNVLTNKFVVDVAQGQPDYAAEQARTKELQLKKGQK
jgi:glutathione synthase/RimK-type ligase-like ATP-grasp enzyme